MDTMTNPWDYNIVGLSKMFKGLFFHCGRGAGELLRSEPVEGAAGSFYCVRFEDNGATR